MSNSRVYRKLQQNRPPQRGADVVALQKAINARYRHFKMDSKVVVDGEIGVKTLTAAKRVALSMGAIQNNRAALMAGRVTESSQRLIRRSRKKTKREKLASASRRSFRRHLRKMFRPSIQEKAYKEAVSLIGIMEHGGNNVGTEVEKIIRGGGGIAGQPWCGWFVAYVYKKAGSKAVSWQWGSVRLLWPLLGIKKTSTPKRGDLVRFVFDHVGMFDKDNGDGTITTIEGNTGASGAVSDSATGGDGVYKKVRSKYLVADYLRVTR